MKTLIATSSFLSSSAAAGGLFHYQRMVADTGHQRHKAAVS